MALNRISISKDPVVGGGSAHSFSGGPKRKSAKLVKKVRNMMVLAEEREVRKE